MAKLQHARFWKYTGNHHAGHDCDRYDPHGYGLQNISTLACLVDSGEMAIEGVSLDGVVVNHHKEDSFGHNVHVAASAEQWTAVANYVNKYIGREIEPRPKTSSTSS